MKSEKKRQRVILILMILGFILTFGGYGLIFYTGFSHKTMYLNPGIVLCAGVSLLLVAAVLIVEWYKGSHRK